MTSRLGVHALLVLETSQSSSGEQVLAIPGRSILVGFAAKDVTKFMGYGLLKQGAVHCAENANQFRAAASRG
jgi:hypothetical protein